MRIQETLRPEQQVHLSLRPKVHLSPQMIQSLKILRMSGIELMQTVRQELEKNLALEIKEEQKQSSFTNSSIENDKQFHNTHNTYIEGKDIQNITQYEVLQDYLLRELSMQKEDKNIIDIARVLINNLDENGFHIEDPYDLFPKNMRDQVHRAMCVVQNLDPIGTCVTDYRESLLVQCRLKKDSPPRTEHVLQQLFYSQEDMHVIRKREGTAVFDVCLTYIKTLSPYPGRNYAKGRTAYVFPDARVYAKYGEIIVVPQNEISRSLSINHEFERLLHGVSQHNDTALFAKVYVQAAKAFIRSIRLRERTSLKVIRATMEMQKDFFFFGVTHLRALAQREIAKSLSLSESTISRISNNRFVQTSQGIYPLKFFFVNGINGISRNNIMAIIEHILAEFPLKRPSDQYVTDKLVEQGVRIARRTVTKYRQMIMRSTIN